MQSTQSKETFRQTRHEAPLTAVNQRGQVQQFEQEQSQNVVYANIPSTSPRPDDDLPSNVSEESQLAVLPQECLSGDKERPLRHVDDMGFAYWYSLSPMKYSVIFILMVELFERFSFYSICYTLTLFLTGAFNEDWNAGFTSVKAASYVSVSTMVAYTTPFVGAFFADSLFGDYKSILVGLLFFYVPGVALVALTTVPHLLGDEFNESLLTLGILVLWPLGTGIVKSIVNVFGAKQYHPVLQSSLIESYYVSFYSVINVGALAGIGIIPIVAQHNLPIAYIIPLVLLACAGTAFVLGTSRYVRPPPRRQVDSICSWGTNKSGKGSAWRSQSSQLQNISLFEIFRISLLIVPFCVGYSQMPTTFIVQGTVMANAFGFINVASLNSLDAISVLVFGSITANYIYPYLAKNGIKIPTTYKFALGSALGALAIAWAMFVEHMIHHAYKTRGGRINVLWQSPAYLLIGFGEIFAVSAAYEVAFTASPPDKKVLASATNIFCVGGLPNLLCIILYHSCSHWFTNSHGTQNIGHIEDYATAHVGKYFFVLLCIMIFGVILNVLPSIRGYVESIEERATDIIRTPAIGKSPLRRPAMGSSDEETPLVTPRTKKYQDYVKFGSGPIYARSGSMRAGPSLSRSDLPGGHIEHVQYKYIPKLYGSESLSTSRVQVATGPDGKPIKVGSLPATAAKSKQLQAPPANLDRMHSMS